MAEQRGTQGGRGCACVLVLLCVRMCVPVCARSDTCLVCAHVQTITCMALDSSGQYVATGEAGLRARILVWSAVTMEVVASLKGTIPKPSTL